MAATIKLGLFLLFWITTTNCSNDLTLPEGERFFPKGNSTGKFQWFKPAQLFIELILPNDIPFPDNITEVLESNEKFDYVNYIRKVLQAEIGILILITIGFLIATILPIALLVSCCCCCFCQAQAESPKAHKSRRWLTASLVLLLLATLPGIIYLFGSTTILIQFPLASYWKVTHTLKNALIYLDTTQMQIGYLVHSSSTQTKLSADLEIDKSLGSNIKKGLDMKMEVTKFLKAISLTSSYMKNATEIIAQINTALDSSQFQTLLTDVRNLKGEISRHCNSGTCSDKLKSEVQKLPVDPIQKILPIDTYLTDLDINLKKPENTFNGIPLKVKQQSASIVENVKDSLKQLEIGLYKIIDTFIPYREPIKDVQAIVDDIVHSKIVQDVRKYGGHCLRAVAAFVLLIWLLFCYGVFFGSVSYQGKERTCCFIEGGLFLVIGVAVMLLGSSGLWFINSILMAVGAHGEQYVCKSLYDTEFRFINRVISILPANLTTIQNTNTSLFDLKHILNNCEDNVGVYQTLNLHNVVNLDNYLEKYDVSEIKKLSNQIHIGSLDSDLVPDQLEAHLDEFVNKFTNAPQQIVNEMYLKRTLDELPDTNISAIDDRKRKIQLEAVKLDLKMIQTNWETLVKYASETKQTIYIGEDLRWALRPNDIQTIIEQEITKFVQVVEMHAKENRNFIHDSIHNKIGCRDVWNLYNSFRSIVCHDNIYPFNGYWFSLGWCLFLFLPMSVIACKLSGRFRRYDYRDRDEIRGK